MSKWNTVKLGEVCEIGAGQGAPQGEDKYCEQGIPFIKAGNLLDLTNGISEKDIQQVNDEVARQYKLKLYSKGTIVFAKSGMSCMKGYVYELKNDCFAVNHLACITPKDIYASYLKYYFVKVPPNRFIKDASYPSISLYDISNIDIPLPSLYVQKHIADTLDKTQVIIDGHKKQLEELDNLIKATFYDMFGDPVVNEKGWKECNLGDICNVVRGGSPRPIEKFLGGTIPWIKIGDATKGDDLYLTSTKEHIIEDGIKKSRYIKAGSMIFANCGVSLGFARIIKFDGCIHDGWLAFDIKDDNLNKIFLLKQLNEKTEFFRKTAPGGTQPNLNTDIMKNTRIVIPSIDLQNKFTEIVTNIEEQKALVKQSIAEAQNLFNSLMNEYFD